MKLILIIGGLALAVLVVQDLRLAYVASGKPREISCAELIANGPGDNAHVVVTGFVLWPDAAVSPADGQDRSRNVVWIPAGCEAEGSDRRVPAASAPATASAEAPMPTNVRLLIKARNVSGSRGLAELAARRKLQGIVTNAIEPLADDQKQELAKFYKGTDFSACWILDLDRSPSLTGKTAVYLFGSVAAIGLGLYLSLWQRKRPVASAMFKPQDLPPVDAEILPDEDSADE